MLLEGSNTSTFLTWVRPDLDKHLKQVRTQVEQIANNANVSDGIESTSKHLTQLKYTFEALVLNGATMVIEEMITVCDELQRHTIRSRKKAFDALMDAIVVVPSYLDRLQAGHHDLPILLLPVINNLRAAYNADLVSEAALFAPELDVPLPELEAPVPGLQFTDQQGGLDESFPAFILRMRRRYEGALLKWLQNQQDVDLLLPIHIVSETMHQRLERTDLRRLWWIASAVIGGLLDGVTDNDVQLRRLFARLHLNLKTLTNGGEEAAQPDIVDAVAQALLFHIAQAKNGSAGVDLLRERFKLQELVPNREVLVRARGAVTGRNRELYKSLGAAVQDEMALVKDALDLELRTGEVESKRRNQSLKALQRLNDTLKMMGLAESAESIDELLPAFENNTVMMAQDSFETNDFNGTEQNQERESLLMELAENLLQVESLLEEQISSLGEPLTENEDTGYIDLPVHEQRRIHTQVLNECIVSLHQVQDGVRQHLNGEPNADFTSGMMHVAGALEMTGSPDIATLTLQLRNALANLLNSARTTEEIKAGGLETVADAVAALELYIAARRDRQANWKHFLNVLKDRLDRLPTDEVGTTPVPVSDQQPAPEKPEPDQQPELQEREDDTLPPALDQELQQVFLEEFNTVFALLQARVPEWLERQEDSGLLTEIRRGFHTLKGSGRMVGADELGDFAWHIEELLNRSLESRVDRIGDVAIIVRLAEAALPALKQRMLQEPTEVHPAAIEAIYRCISEITEGKRADWNRLSRELPRFLAALVPGSDLTDAAAASGAPSEEEQLQSDDDKLKNLVCRELSDNLQTLTRLVDRISKDRETVASDDDIRAVHSIAGTTAIMPLGLEPKICIALESFLKAQQGSGLAFTDTAMWAIATSLVYLQTCLSIHQGDPHAALEDNAEFQVRQLQELTVEFGTTRAPDTDTTVPQAHDEQQVVETQQPGPDMALPDTAADSPKPPVAAVPESGHDPIPETTTDTRPDAADPIDSEILAIFLEEASDILGRCDSLLDSWRDDLLDLDIVQKLQRELHTFKGGARMSGVSAMGDLSHAMESLLERIANHALPPSVSAIEALEQGCDRLNTWVGQIEKGILPTAGQALTLFNHQADALTAVPVQPTARVAEPREEVVEETELREIQDVELADVEPADVEPADVEPAVPEPVDVTPVDVELPTPEPERIEAAEAEVSGPQQVRVDADLLDSLVNSAGEISIFRSRLEQQVESLRENLGEFDETISRLRRQFRKLEIETETQIRSRFRDEPQQDTGEFDPLELDQFSSIQQLSRGLSESVADLFNLQEMLDEAARKSDALLVQQSRASKQLQEGLLQTRMVPFGTIAPRLRRIVRTASNEIGKKARLQLRVAGGNDQLDRNVLERITAPLEHLLRNAIVHGIESPGARADAGKPEEGEVSITVAAEATEFVVRVRDDGAGLDLDAIRKQAIKTGIIDSNTYPQPEQLMQFILHSGFTTTSKVTGLAGRGVGMDVVNNDIKQIGGSLEIQSETGKGSCFTIRIPFTLAVMQAIGVMAGERRYLIPLSSVAGVARMLPADYQQLLAADSPTYEFAGRQYPILELEPLLGEQSTPLGNDPVSVLMINSGDQKAAFRVPQLLGHREIVIKPIGPQISSVPGILGGTITGDGRVVIIIDAGPLIRRALLTDARPAPPMETADLGPRKVLALVVDDSITMRKVTTRVLEGHDFEVITARDGIEATEQMQERIPDLLLLDVEMPRMDGYAVAEYVRADARLRELPIIMITSRAGKKHRERGMKAGADSYLAKPYKESELINEVNTLLKLEGHYHGE